LAIGECVSAMFGNQQVTFCARPVLRGWAAGRLGGWGWTTVILSNQEFRG